MADSAINLTSTGVIHYPDSDGEPMGENDWHIQFITLIYENLKHRFREQRDEVYVACDLFWYAEEGKPKAVQAPDNMVVFGRGQYNRRSYKQWEEDDIPPAVTIEVDSPSKRAGSAKEKRKFYEKHGVSEHYEFDLLKNPQTIGGWIRVGNGFEKIPDMDGWESPTLGIKFAIKDGVIELYHPDDSRFLDADELRQLARVAEERAEAEAKRAAKLEQKLRDAGIDPE